MNQFKKLAGQTAIYGISSILGRVLNYLLVPLYTSFFSPDEYGVVTELYAYVAFLNVLYTFGLETTFFRFASKESGGTYFNSIQSIIFIVAIILSTTLVFAATPIVNFLQYPGKEQFVYWFSAIMAIDSIVAIPFAKLRLESKAKRFAATRLFNILLNIGLNLFFYWELIWPEIAPFKIYNPEIGVGYVFISNLIANAFYILLMGDILIEFRISWTNDRLRKIFHYSIPLVFTGLAAVTNEMLSRAILKSRLPDGFYDGLSNLDALGIFGACYKLSIFMVLSIQAFKYAVEPFFFSKSDDKNSPELFAKIMNGYIVFSSILLLGVTINLDVLGSVFLQQEVYRQGLQIVPYLLLGGLFLGVFYNLSVWYKLTDKTRWAAYISIIGAVVTFLLNWFLIPIFGYMGSAYTTVIVYMVMVVMSYSIGQKYFPVPYKVVRGMTYIITMFLLGNWLYNVETFHWLFDLVLKNLIFLIVIGIVLKVEKVNLAQILRR